MRIDRARPTRHLATSMLVAATALLAPAAADAAPLTERQQADTARYLQDAVDANDIPGASLAVIRDGQVTRENVGLTSAGTDVTSDTPFLIGSLSKTVTALTVLQLVEGGQVDLDAPIEQYLTGFDYDAPGDEPITARHLLEQTSGITERDGLDVTDRSYDAEDGITEATRRLSGVTLATTPGEEYAYTSANYLLLGAIVETVTGDRYANAVEDRVFAPLGMDSTTATRADAEASGLEDGYGSWFGQAVDRGDSTYDNSGAPYGYLSSTTNDLVKFLEYMQGDGAPLLDRERFALLTAPPEGDRTYGMGWFYDSDAKRFSHGGATPEFRAEMFYVPGEDFAAVLLTNKYHAFEDGQVSDIMSGIRSIAANEDPAAPARPTPLVQLALAALAVALLVKLAFGLVGVARRSPVRHRAWRAVASAFALVALVGLGPVVSYALATPWRSISLFAPDVAVLLTVVAVLFGAIGIVGIVRQFVARRTPDRAMPVVRSRSSAPSRTPQPDRDRRLAR